MNVKEKVKDAFKPKTGKAKTMRMARDFCVLEVLCCILAVYFSVKGAWTYTALAIIAEFFEWRFFSLSLRLRRYEERDEQKSEKR
jgi:hypothetical protein